MLKRHGRPQRKSREVERRNNAGGIVTKIAGKQRRAIIKHSDAALENGPCRLVECIDNAQTRREVYRVSIGLAVVAQPESRRKAIVEDPMVLGESGHRGVTGVQISRSAEVNPLRRGTVVPED